MKYELFSYVDWSKLNEEQRVKYKKASLELAHDFVLSNYCPIKQSTKRTSIYTHKHLFQAITGVYLLTEEYEQVFRDCGYDISGHNGCHNNISKKSYNMLVDKESIISFKREWQSRLIKLLEIYGCKNITVKHYINENALEFD